MTDSSQVEEALNRLVDDPEFQRLNQLRARFNFFEAIGAERVELRHSNFLRFLLSPSRPHGMSARFLRQFLRVVIAKLPVERRPLRPLELVVADLDNTVIYREFYNFDLLIEVKDLRLVVLVENKIDSREGAGQLQRYKQEVYRRYKDWRSLFVFLTPKGLSASDSDFVAFSYRELATLIDAAIENGEISPDAEVLLRHYLEMLRRNVVPNEALEAIAKKLYDQYYDAFEYVFAQRQEGSNIRAIAALLEDQSDLIVDSEGRNVLRFFPADWDDSESIGPKSSTGWSPSGRSLLFEIKTSNKSDRVLLALVVGPTVSELRSKIYNAAVAAPDVFVSLQRPMGKKWATIFSLNLLTDEEAQDKDEAEVASIIRTRWNDFTIERLPALVQAIHALVAGLPPPKAM